MKGLLALFSLGLGLWWSSPPRLQSGEGGLIFTLFLLGLLSEALLLSSWGAKRSRTSCVIVLALLMAGKGGFFAAICLVLVGNLLLVLNSKGREAFATDSLLTLGPLGAVAASGLALPEPLPKLATALCFVLLMYLCEPRRFSFKSSQWAILCSPWLGIALADLGKQHPATAILAAPVLLLLAGGSRDRSAFFQKFREALQSTQLESQKKGEKVRALSALLKAANRMTRTLDQEELRQALKTAAIETGLSQVEVFLPGEMSGGKEAVPLLGGRGKLCYIGSLGKAEREQVEVLGKIFSTAWENARLHHQVQEALAETKRSQAQMVQSSRMAAIGLMAAGVAHEVNTPLGAIQLSAELAEIHLGKNNDSVLEQLQSICRATERAHKAVERVLYYSRPLNSEEKESFSLSEVVADSVELLSHHIVRADVTIEQNIPEGIEMRGDRQGLFTLVFNLLLNGVFAAQGTEEAKVWCRAQRTEGSVVFELQDSGEGVNSKDRERIFEAFYTTKPKGEGTGLGLHLAKQAAALFGGQLELANPGRQGAIFRATFPLEGEN